MAHIFSDENGNIGTIIVLKGQPQDYLPETHTYHGEHEILDEHIVEALVVNNGVLEHDADKLKAYMIQKVHDTYNELRAVIREELHDAFLDDLSDVEIQVIKDKITQLKIDRDAAIDAINGYTAINDIVNIDPSTIPVGGM